jgi:hypothetical protein
MPPRMFCLTLFCLSCTRPSGTASPPDSGAPALASAATDAGAPCTPTPLTASAILTSNILPCDGACAIYRITIHGDGAVEYSGEKNVKVIGARATKLDPAATRALFESAECGAFAPQPKPTGRFGHGRSGISQAEVTLDLGRGPRMLKAGRSRECDASSEPHARPLCELSYAIDDAVNVEEWVGYSPKKGVRAAGQRR